jgi:hypothetical protein
MVTTEGKFRRKTKQVFYYMPVNITDSENIDNKIEHEYKSVEDYRFINNFHDIAANTAMGTYGHRVLTHNLYDKSFATDDYNYHTSFAETKHTDFTTSQFDTEKYVVGESDTDETPADTQRQTSKVSDYPESRVSVQSTTQYLHNDKAGAGYGLDVLEDGRKLGQAIAQSAQVIQGTCLKLIIKGQSYIEAGDLIEFKMRAVDEKNPDGEEDPQYSGNYVVTKVRHQINATKYVMVLECAKDSVKTGYSKLNKKIPRNKNIATLRDTYIEEKGDTFGGNTSI